jgi:ABC-type multidrug transport system fused ATPase/permease subunit
MSSNAASVDGVAEQRGRRGTPFLWELRPYFRQVAGLLVLGSICGILMNVFIVLPAVFLGRAINTVLAYHEGHASSAAVGRAAVAFVVATAATEVPRIGKRWWLGVARTRFQANVRSDALRGVLAWPMDRLAAMSVGGVMARVIGDVQVLGLGVGEVIVETWDTLLFSASLVVTMFIYAPGLAAAALAPVPFALWLAKAAGRRVAVRTTNARQSDADLTTVLHEQLGAFRLLRLAGRAGVATSRVHLLADRQAVAELDAIRLETGLAAIYTTMLTAGVVFVFVLGGHRVAAGAMSVGGLIAFLQLFVRFVRRAPRIPQMANRVQAAGAAYVRLQPLLAQPPPLSAEPAWSSFRFAHVAGIETPPPTAPPTAAQARALSFQAVSFSYPGSMGSPAIADLDLEVPAGTLLAITGPVGSGKSALARLAAGVYPPDQGRVLIDGMPVAKLEPLQRAQRIGYLGQEPHLFSGSVVENVLLIADESSADLEDRRLLEAVWLAALEPDVQAMPDGLQTEIGELGVRVSGGQRQRIALARALAAGGAVPGLLVLDDPFSAVDVHTEASIAAALREAVGDQSTIVLCSHRLAAFPYADEIVVLDHGRIEERGTHTELLAAEGLYARIYRAQARLSSAHDAVAGRTQ